MATPLEVKQVWTGMLALYPHYAKERSAADLKETLKLYQELLADVPGEALLAAARQHATVSKFFPTIAELRQPALALAQPARELAMEAWGTVTDTFSRGEYYFYESGVARGPTWDNPITARIVQCMGGYFELCKSENLTADRARFIEAYEQLAQREHAESLLLPEVRELRAKLLNEQIVKPLAKQLAGRKEGMK